MRQTNEPKTPARRRTWRRILAGAGILVAIALASFPWWLPVAVTRIGGAFGVEIGSWKSLGWNTIEYRDLRFSEAGTAVSADTLRIPRFLIAPGENVPGGETPVEVGTVRVTLKPRPEQAGQRPPPAVSAIVAQVESVWTALRKWLPDARAHEVAIESGDFVVMLRDVRWSGAGLSTAVFIPDRGVEARVSIGRSDVGSFAIDARVPDLRGSARVAIAPRADGGTRIEGTVTWRDMPVTLQATFAPDGLVPERATVDAAALSVPAADFGLEGYGPIQGAIEASWSRDAYQLSVVAHGDPLSDSPWPAIDLDLRAAGDLASLRLDAVDVRIPGVDARLSQPLEVAFDGGAPVSPAEFSIDADLSAFPALEARGRIGGSATVRAGANGAAAVDLAVRGEGLGWRGVEGATLTIEGSWRQPEIVLKKAVVDLGENVRSELSGTVDVARREVRDVSLRAVIPEVLWRAFSEKLPPCERIELTAGAQGSWDRIAHHGQAAVTGFEWTPGRRIGATVDWSGEGTGAAVRGEVALAGGGSLPFAFEAARGQDGAIDGTIESIRWTDATGEWWRLEHPVPVHFAPGGEFAVGPWNVVGEAFQLAGEARVRWPAVGDVSLVLTGLDGARIGGVLPEAIRNGRIEHVDLRAAWDHGPARVQGSLRAMYSPVKDTSFTVQSEFATQEDSLAFGSIEVLDASGAVLRGVARIPLQIAGSEDGFRLDLLRDGPVELDLASEPNPVFWQSVADITGWSVENPELSCRLRGSIAQPRGELQLSAATLRPPEDLLDNGGRLPVLTGLSGKFVADDEGLSIVKSMVAIDHRWVTLSGRAPWEIWRRWRESGEIQWHRAAFSLASNPLPIAIASGVFPTALAGDGEVSIGVTHEPGAGLSGRVWLHGAATRPLGPLGAVREIRGELGFSSYTVVLTRLEGLLSGQPVRVTGEAHLEEARLNAFALNVRSSRVPLVRRPGLIVRAEVNLDLRREATGPASVAGRVDFGPSVFSTDLLELLPTGGVDRPESRPPYFSVEEEPFSEWTLAVAVHGEAFLQVNTPFYRDLLSADAKLSGTLGEPRVEGWVWGSDGMVTFPFGRIPVEQMLVTLSRDNPYEPRLALSGSGRVMGYDIRMEAAGPASEPRLLFTSDPPLTSQQVFMMLSTGAVPDDPRGGDTSGRASRLALFVGRNLAAGLGLGGDGGGDERLDVRSGEDFTRQGRETVFVQYDLDGRWSLVGEYDRFDAYNAGIKFRLINR